MIKLIKNFFGFFRLKYHDIVNVPIADLDTDANENYDKPPEILTLLIYKMHLLQLKTIIILEILTEEKQKTNKYGVSKKDKERNIKDFLDSFQELESIFKKLN